MMRHKFQLLGAVLVSIALAGTAPPARADFEVQFSFGGASVLIDATTGQITYSGGAKSSGLIYIASPTEVDITSLVVSPNGSSGGFKVTATVAESNSPGAENVATLSLSSLKIVNQGATTGTLTVTTGDTGFTQPKQNPALLTSTMSATASGTNNATNSVVFNSYLDTTNTQFGQQQGSPTITLSVAPGVSGSDNESAFVNASQTPYSLTQVAQFTLAGGNYFTDGSSGTTVTAPAPAGILLVLSGLPLACLFYLRRRVPPAVA
jgi:hypothetical protein